MGALKPVKSVCRPQRGVNNGLMTSSRQRGIHPLDVRVHKTLNHCAVHYFSRPHPGRVHLAALVSIRGDAPSSLVRGDDAGEGDRVKKRARSGA